MQFAVGHYGRWRWTEEREWDAPAGPDIINAFRVSNIIGVRFRNAIAGQRARIICNLTSPDGEDPVFESGLLSAGSIASNGLASSGAGVIAGDVSSVGTVASGAGFTVVRNGVGNYTVTFTTPFAANPGVAVTALSGAFRVCTINPISPNAFTVNIVDAASNAQDTAFAFVAALST
jgi:hypothetical protein